VLKKAGGKTIARGVRWRI